MISQIRFKEFKSFADTNLPVEPITIIIGANASGKSNAIDALQILSGIATNRELADILDGIRGKETGVRGGSSGAPRYEGKSFELGCTVNCGDYDLEYDIRIEVEPRVWLSSESLHKRFIDPNKKSYFIYETFLKDDESDDIQVIYSNRLKGGKLKIPFLRNYSILSQIPGRLPSEARAKNEILAAFDKVTTVLRGILILNPLPQMMRDYVHLSRTKLLPTAENLSSVIAGLIKIQKNKAILLEFLQDIPEQQIIDVKVLETPTGDVMIRFIEQFGTIVKPIDTRGMSDGTLRYLAVLAALVGENPGSTIVIEEVDNGLHPSRAYKLIGALKKLGSDRGIDVIVTTHNPALLNALDANDMPGVVVCYRDAIGGDSKFISWIDLPDYPELMTEGKIGDIVTRKPVAWHDVSQKREVSLRWVEGRL